MKPAHSAIPEREKVEAPPRRSLTPAERYEMWVAQKGLCSCGCGDELIDGLTDEEHTLPLWLQDRTRHNGKPDALMIRGHHIKKTAIDKGIIAHVKRLCGITGKRKPGAKVKKLPAGRPLKSRGFATADERKRAKEWRRNEQ